MSKKFSTAIALIIPALILYTVYNAGKSIQGVSQDVYDRIVSVSDGDTVTLANGVRGEHHVRYLGVDAPEMKEPFYIRAKEFNRRLVQHKNVRVVTMTRGSDDYKRTLALIYVKKDLEDKEEILVNLKLVEEGLAYVYSRDIIGTKYFDLLMEAQKKAIEQEKNVWGRLNLSIYAVLESKRPLFHLNTGCKANKDKQNSVEITVREAFLRAATACRHCKRGIWRQ